MFKLISFLIFYFKENKPYVVSSYIGDILYNNNDPKNVFILNNFKFSIFYNMNKKIYYKEYV